MEDRLARFSDTNTAEASMLTLALGGSVHPVGDGTLVLMGPGFFVNRAMGLGLTEGVRHDQLDRIEELSSQVGVPSEVECSEQSDHSLIELLDHRRYQLVASVTALACELSDVDDAIEATRRKGPPMTIREVSGPATIAWKQTAAAGFGYTAERQRAVSDAFVDAADAVPEIRLLVASIDGVDVATASWSVHGRTAQFGGMTSIPSARRRGVQHELLLHRLHLAQSAGCDLAISSAETGSQSERNLRRIGFDPVAVLTYRRAAGSG